MDNETTEELVSRPETQRRLGGIGETTLWEMTAPRGPLHPVRLGRRVMYRASELRLLIESGRTAEGGRIWTGRNR